MLSQRPLRDRKVICQVNKTFRSSTNPEILLKIGPLDSAGRGDERGGCQLQQLSNRRLLLTAPVSQRHHVLMAVLLHAVTLVSPFLRPTLTAYLRLKYYSMARMQRAHDCVAYRARQLYKNISMLFLFPVKDGKLSSGVNATFDASCYG